MDFVTGKAAQTVIADSLDRRSVRKDVEAAAYLPDKEEIHMITADENMVNEKREQWKQRFTEIFTYCTQAETCENKIQQDHIGTPSLRRCPGNETGTLFSG